MLGVNVSHHDPGELKKVMIRENLNWRSLAGQGAVTELWNVPATPTTYLIDHVGVIRRKWVGSAGEQTIDAALDELIAEASKAAGTIPPATGRE